MKLKYSIFLFLLFSILSVGAQEIMEYERKIKNAEQYEFKEIEFFNKENVKLSGTLIKPKNGFEKIIIIQPGSGKDTRYSHPKLTEEFLKNNIAVYRYDERGVGKSDGEYSRKISTLKNDLYSCVKSLRSLENIKNKELGILGHSLGGMGSIGIFEFNPDVDFLIQMATPVNAGNSFKNRVSEQGAFKSPNKTIEETEKLIDTFNILIRSIDDYELVKKKCNKIRRKQKFPKSISRIYLSPQIVDIVKIDTEFLYKKIDIPTLFIIGDKDKLIDVKYGANKLKEFDNKNLRIEVLENMDHCLTYNMGEWSKSNESNIREIDDFAIDKIINWINEL